MKKLLIIGKTPPPIGGVTIHVKRLIDSLKKNNVKHKFLPLSVFNLFILPLYFVKYKQIHLHTSSITVQYYISTLCFFLGIKSIITFHGDLNRFDDTNLKKVRKIIKRTTIPIVLNDGSYEISNKINQSSVLVSSFIPPINNEKLDKNIIEDIFKLKNKYLKVYCTSATGITFDKEGNEIYGVIDLVQLFIRKPSLSLIVSDSSAEYINYFKKNVIEIPSNIYFISQPHSMYNVLELIDGFIRNTSTDGDSIAIKESLYLNKNTFTTNVVSRPRGSIIYKRGDYLDLISKLENNNFTENSNILDGSKDLIKIYFS